MIKKELTPDAVALRDRAIKDVIVIGVLAIAVFLISARFDVFDWIVSWVREHESLPFDEIFTVSIFLLFAGLVFVWRRRDELIDQIQKRERAESEKAALVPALEKALREVQALSELLPVCAWCKKIRDDDGVWNQLDVYLQKHTTIGVTHGICPDCAERMKRS